MCLAILACLGSFFEYSRSNGYSVKLFSDWDEAPYFISAQQIARDSTSIFNLARADYLPERGNPSNVSDYLVGKLWESFNLTPVELGLVLDCFCILFSYLVWFLVFFHLCRNKKIASISSILALFFPWLLSPLTYLPETFAYFGPITFSGHEAFPSTGPIRAIHTQASYPLFAFAILMALKAQTSSKLLLPIILSAVSTGLLLYSYVFGWLSAAAISGMLLLVALFKREDFKLSFFIIWTTIFLAVSSPGLSMILENRPSEALFYGVFGEELSSVLYFPLEKCLVLFCVFYCLRKSLLKSDNQTVFLVFGLIITFSDLLLTNLQAFSSTWLAPYHFSMFYLDPLFIGTISSFILSTANFSNRSQRLSLYQFSLVICVAVFSFKNYTFPWHPSDTTKDGLFRAVSELVPDDKTVGVPIYIHPIGTSNTDPPFSPNLPYLVSALSQKTVLGKTVTYSTEREPFMKRELAMSWYLSGKVQLLGNCVEAPPQVAPSVIRNAHIFITFLRHKSCLLVPSLLVDFGPCDILTEMPIDYLVRVSEFVKHKENSLDKYYELVWASDNGFYELLKVDLAKMKKDFCHGKIDNYQDVPDSLSPTTMP